MKGYTLLLLLLFNDTLIILFFIIRGEEYPLNELWREFCKIDGNFIYMYSIYHYFKGKGWIVKSGIKYGADFCKLIQARN